MLRFGCWRGVCERRWRFYWIGGWISAALEIGQRADVKICKKVAGQKAASQAGFRGDLKRVYGCVSL